MRETNLMQSICKYTALAAGAYFLGKCIVRSINTISMKGKVVLITGGTRGLGIILARKIAGEGAKVVICGRSEESLQQASKDLESKSAPHLAIQCDVADKQQIKDMIRQINETFGTVDVLINNAGIIQVGPMEVMEEEDYQNAMNVHFWGPLHLMNEVLPSMKKKKLGRIVNINSIGGIVSFPHLLPYNASKHALSGLSEGITAELNNLNIKITTVYPGLMRTGSPRNIKVKGQHQKEYAWFKIFDSLPVASINADKAGQKIIDAMKAGDKTLILSVPAKLVNVVHAIAPHCVMKSFWAINRLLPDKPEDDSTEEKKGHESESKISRSAITDKTDHAAIKNLET